jgi:hypothetical protein
MGTAAAAARLAPARTSSRAILGCRWQSHHHENGEQAFHGRDPFTVHFPNSKPVASRNLNIS